MHEELKLKPECSITKKVKDSWFQTLSKQREYFSARLTQKNLFEVERVVRPE